MGRNGDSARYTCKKTPLAAASGKSDMEKRQRRQLLQLQKTTKARQEQRPWQNFLYNHDDKGQRQWPLRYHVGHSAYRCWVNLGL